MTFKAIVFDYGNVLAGDPGPETGNNLIAALGVSPDDYARAYFSYNKQVNRGEITWEQLWNFVLADLDRMDKLPIALAQNRTHEASLENLNQNVVDLAVRLKNQGYKIGVLSNTTPDGAKRIHSKLAPYNFDVIHCSAETGNVKPDVAAFSAVADALAITMPEMVFVDDSTRSLSTSEECGYLPILFKDYTELVSALTFLGIDTD